MVLLALNVFVLMFAYYLIKTVREALILSQTTPENKVYLYGAISILLVPYARSFGALAGRVSRIRLIAAVTMFFASNLVVFCLLGEAGVEVGVPFFVWVSVFNVSIVALFWSFANDLYTEEQGERLFAIVAAGMTLGAVAGAYGAEAVFAPLGAYGLMLVAGALLVASLGLTWFIHVRTGQARIDHASPPAAGEPAGMAGAFRSILANRYLLLVGVVTLLGACVNTTGEYILDRTLVERAHELIAHGQAHGLSMQAFIGRFKGDFYMWVNIVVVAMQLLVVSRVLKHIGVRYALLVLPVVALGGYTAMMITPALTVIFVAKVAENGTDYSLQNTVRQALFLVTSRADKYEAKAVIDTVFFRAGDTVAALVVLVGSALALGTRSYVVAVMGLVVGWAFAAVATARARSVRRPTAAPMPPAPARAVSSYGS